MITTLWINDLLRISCTPRLEDGSKRHPLEHVLRMPRWSAPAGWHTAPQIRRAIHRCGFVLLDGSRVCCSCDSGKGAFARGDVQDKVLMGFRIAMTQAN